MTAVLLIVLLGACIFLAIVALVLHEENATLRRKFEEESAWADEYARQAETAKVELSEMKQKYAVLNWLHEGTIAMEQSAAWLVGLGLKK